jgi:diadenosine tetraphosphate (Ap4A) HIT family hydrolase
MCIFCDKIDKERILFDTANWIAFYDAFPVSKGHVLLIPKEHFETYFDLPDSYKDSIDYRISQIKAILDDKYHPDGYNIGFNRGKASGQSVMHFHMHIIPRYKGDVDNPKGGIRGCIPSKMSY